MTIIPRIDNTVSTATGAYFAATLSARLLANCSNPDAPAFRVPHQIAFSGRRLNIPSPPRSMSRAGQANTRVEDAMPKYLFEGRYNAEGAKGVAREGGSGRREAIKKMLEGLGGKLDSVYFAFGDIDAYVVADLPDNEAAAAASLAVNQSGVAAA